LGWTEGLSPSSRGLERFPRLDNLKSQVIIVGEIT
jgi:hypothetical protein